MVLIVTNRRDLTADWLILELERRAASFVRFNTEDFPSRCSLSWSPEGDAIFRLGSQCCFHSDKIRSVWYRRPAPAAIPADLPDEDAAWAARESKAALDGALEMIPAQWVSHPEAIRGASSKPLQLRDARSLGFDVPDTVITNDPDELERLWQRSPDGVVCKALTDGRVRTTGEQALLFTTQIDHDQVAALGPEPHLFQALVPKLYDVRITVIGDDIFATRIESQVRADGRVDWRRAEGAKLKHTREQLPDELADRCLELVHRYGLRFGAVDLAKRPDGRYTFFELNPNGQWAWIEQRTGVPLRSHLANLLTT